MSRRADARLWLVLPAYDDDRLAGALEQYKSTLRTRDRLVVVVYVNSNGAAEVARRAAATDRRLIIVGDRHKIGTAEDALLTGYHFATAHGAAGDAVCYVGTDGGSARAEPYSIQPAPRNGGARLDGLGARTAGRRSLEPGSESGAGTRSSRQLQLAGLRRRARGEFRADRTSTADGRKVLSTGQKVVLITVALALIAGLTAARNTALVAICAVLTAFSAAANLAKLELIRRGANDRRKPAIDLGASARLPDEELPMYTILLPLYREDAVLEQLIAGIQGLDYPRAKLDVRLLLEEDDVTTREAVAALALPSCFETVIVPDDGPTGKPRACNAGLDRAKGEYLVIYDAEDRPERDQLRRAVAAFMASPPDVVCMQAKLNYFNRRHNLLTRWFTAEYSLWFDHLLPGLQAMDVAIPLGGTSNHFRTARLRQLGGWDAFNVTEDADLGVRLYVNGWKTAILDSTTYEEATSRAPNWIRQRSRWVKGYIQTYLWHMCSPLRTWRLMGSKAFAMLHLFFGAATLCVILNPVYWLLTVAWFAEHYHIIHVLFPRLLLYLGVVGLFVGNAAFILAAISGAYGRRNFEDVKWALLVPAYWLLMSVAAWKAVFQLWRKPFYWEKTVHGHCLYMSEESVAIGGEAGA